MIWIILLLALATLFILAEIFFIPGTTVAGIVGLVLAATGIYLVYAELGTDVGHITLGAYFVFISVMAVIGIRSGAWNKFSSKDVISGRVNVLADDAIAVGDMGKAVSTIRPMGKAMIGEQYFEVRSYGSYISSGEKIRVVKVDGNRIFVQPAGDDQEK